MIEQLCYTRSSIGLSGTTEFQVRAASDGIADINSARFAAFDKYLRYTLPAGTERSLATTETSPCSLAYVEAGSEHIVVHKVYTGRDSRGRPGVYFAHMLAELPKTFSVRTAIDMWRSSFWLTSESQLNDPRSVRLPLIAPTQLEEQLSLDHAPTDRYDLSALKEEHLYFIVQLFAHPAEQQKLYIAAPDSQTATLLWGLVHSLPLTMLKGLTFSTYEHDLENATMRIVGTCRPLTSSERAPSLQRDLLESYYTGQTVGLNCYTNEHTPIVLQPELAPYITYAIDCLTHGRQNELAALIALAEILLVDTLDAFLLLYEWNAEEGELSPEDTTQILQHMRLAIYFLKKSNIRRSIMNHSITNPLWWQKDGERLITNLYAFYHQHPNDDAQATLDLFVRETIHEACAAMLESHKKPLGGLAKILDATHIPAYWIEMLDAITVIMHSWSPAQKYSWKEREWFVLRWAYGIQNISDAQIAPWLECLSIDELEQLLSAPIPVPWRIQAVVVLLLLDPIPAWVIQLVSNYYSFLRDALLYVIEQTTMPQNALDFFAYMVEQNVSHKMKIELLGAFLRTKASFDKDGLLQIAKLSPDDITYLLKTEFAIDFLKRDAIQQNIIGLAMTNRAWAAAGGLPAIANIFEQYRQKKDPNASAILDGFCKRIVNYTANAMIANKGEQKGLLSLLSVITPAELNANYWAQLFLHLSNAITNPSNPWKPSEIYELSDRLWFLEQCAYGYSQIPTLQATLPWLENIVWEDLEAVLSAPLPDSWRVQAIILLLLASPEPLSATAIRLIVDYHDLFRVALLEMVEQNPRLVKRAIDFFIEIAERNIPVKIEMLAALLVVKNNTLFDADELLRCAKLSPDQAIHFFKQYGRALLMRKGSGTSERVQKMIGLYVSSLTFHDITESQTRELLKHIRDYSSPHMPQGTQQSLKEWQTIEQMVLLPYTTFYVTNSNHIQVVGAAIQNLQLQKQEDFTDLLFTFIVHIWWKKAEKLNTALEILSRFFMNASAKDVNKAKRELLRQIVMSLHKITTLLNDYAAPDEILTPYVVLSIFYADDLKGRAKDDFIEPLFKAMLGKIERRTFDTLDHKAETWSEEIYKGWQHYSAGLRPKTSIGRFGSAMLSVIPKPFTLLSNNATSKQVSSPNEPEAQNTAPPPIQEPAKEEDLASWITKVAEVKKMYIDYRIDKLLNTIKNSKDDPATKKYLEYLVFEHEKLQIIKEKREKTKEWWESAQEDIRLDNLIILYLHSFGDYGPGREKRLKDMVEQEIVEVYKEFKKYDKNAYKKLNKERNMKEEDIKGALVIFIRYYCLAADLYEQQSIILDDGLSIFQNKYRPE